MGTLLRNPVLLMIGSSYFGLKLIRYSLLFWLPYYLRRDVTLVAWSGELAFGQSHDPQRWIPTLAQFDTHWRALPRGAAMMPRALFQQMQQAGLPMRVVYEDPRRVVVVRS